MLTRTFFARAPLAPGRFAPLPAGAVTAGGSLRTKLVALRGGLLSSCASLFPESSESSAFFGGSLVSGVKAGNLLEAMLLTSAVLSDEELRRKALHLSALAVQHQREDGFFGSEEDSFAARGRMLRALCAAYSMTGDKQLLTFMLRYMKYLKDTLDAQPLSAEDAMHTGDTLEAGVFLYNVTGQKAILSVLMTLVTQGADYTSLYHAFPYRTPVSRTMSEESLLNALAGETEDGYCHHLLRTANAANLCEGLRASSLCGVLTGSGKHLSAAETGLVRMNKTHGAVCGGITGDPLLAGAHPSRGVSALSLTELAASLESMLSCPAGEHGADQLETVMYNGVAAAFAADGMSVQPVQQANQAAVTREARFPLSAEDANLFALSDGETLSALLGAWPRFAQHQWMLSRDDGLFAVSYAPCQVRYRLGGAAVRLNVESCYPASGSVRITVSPDQDAAFPIHLRIPAWAKGATAAVSGEILPAQAGTILTINRQWHSGDVILLTLPMAAERITGFHQTVCVARGPLRFAYAPAYDSETDESGAALLRAKENFGVALDGSAPLEAKEQDGHVTIRTRAIPLARWGMRGASCDQPPMTLDSTDAEAAIDVTLIPYAEAPIRLSALPQA